MNWILLIEIVSVAMIHCIQFFSLGITWLYYPCRLTTIIRFVSLCFPTLSTPQSKTWQPFMRWYQSTTSFIWLRERRRPWSITHTPRKSNSIFRWHPTSWLRWGHCSHFASLLCPGDVYQIKREPSFIRCLFCWVNYESIIVQSARWKK